MVRFKNRYLLAEFDWHDGRVDDSMTETALVGVIRKEMWASMTLLREVKGRSVAVRVRHCASTLRSSQRAAIERMEHRYARVARRMPGGERSAAKGAADASRAIRALQP